MQRARRLELFKAPGVAETIDWANALVALDRMSLDPQSVSDTLGVLLKYQEDVARLEGGASAAILDELTRQPSIVLATGGGAVMRDENRRLLAERGLVIFLQASLADLWQRLRRDRTRPLLQTGNPRERIAELLALREPLYREIATLTVVSARQPVDELVADIIGRLPEEIRAESRADSGPGSGSG